jgi:hypothetical protein
VHSYYDGQSGLQLPLLRVRGTRQHGYRRGRLAGSDFGPQENPTRFKTENGFPGIGNSASIKGLRLAIKWRPSRVGIYFPIASLWRKPSSYLNFLLANLAMVPGLTANSDESAKSGGKWRKW